MRTVEFAIVSLHRPANKAQTAIKFPGLPAYQGAQYKVQIVGAGTASNIFDEYENLQLEVKGGHIANAEKELAKALTSSLGALRHKGEGSAYDKMVGVFEESREMKLGTTARNYPARVVKKLKADFELVKSAELDDFCELANEGLSSDFLKELNAGLASQEMVMVPVAVAL